MSDNQKLAKLSPLAKELEDRGLRSKAIAALERNLFAEHRVYDIENKKLITYDDGKTQIAAALGLLAYTDGKPVERREIVTKHMTSLQELQAKVKNSPALREAINELLEEKDVTPKADKSR